MNSPCFTLVYSLPTEKCKHAITETSEDMSLDGIYWLYIRHRWRHVRERLIWYLFLQQTQHHPNTKTWVSFWDKYTSVNRRCGGWFRRWGTPGRYLATVCRRPGPLLSWSSCWGFGRWRLQRPSASWGPLPTMRYKIKHQFRLVCLTNVYFYFGKLATIYHHKYSFALCLLRGRQRVWITTEPQESLKFFRVCLKWTEVSWFQRVSPNTEKKSTEKQTPAK